MLSQCTRWPPVSLHLVPEIGLGCRVAVILALMLWQCIYHTPGLTTGLCAWPTRSNFSWTHISSSPAERDLIHDAISSLSCQLWTWKWLKDSGLIHKYKKKKHTQQTHSYLFINPTLLYPSPTQQAEWPNANTWQYPVVTRGWRLYICGYIYGVFLWLSGRVLRCGFNSQGKGCGFNSQGTHILTKCIAWMHCKPLWIKASA